MKTRIHLDRERKLFRGCYFAHTGCRNAYHYVFHDKYLETSINHSPTIPVLFYFIIFDSVIYTSPGYMPVPTILASSCHDVDAERHD